MRHLYEVREQKLYKGGGEGGESEWDMAREGICSSTVQRMLR